MTKIQYSEETENEKNVQYHALKDGEAQQLAGGVERGMVTVEAVTGHRQPDAYYQARRRRLHSLCCLLAFLLLALAATLFLLARHTVQASNAGPRFVCGTTFTMAEGRGVIHERVELMRTNEDDYDTTDVFSYLEVIKENKTTYVFDYSRQQLVIVTDKCFVTSLENDNNFSRTPKQSFETFQRGGTIQQSDFIVLRFESVSARYILSARVIEYFCSDKPVIAVQKIAEFRITSLGGSRQRRAVSQRFRLAAPNAENRPALFNIEILE